MARIPKDGPVSVRNVMDVLATDITSVVRLCSNATKNINIFSTRRPIVHPSLGGLTDAERMAANLGFTMNQYSTPAELYSALQAGTAWSAPFPDGTYPGQPCRLGDFRGYDHDARPFVPAEGDIALDDGNPSHLFFGQRVIQSTDDIGWTQMAQVASAYPCLVIFNSKGALLGWKTAAKAWGEGGADIPLSVIDDAIINKEVDYTYMLCCSGACKTSFMSTTAARKFFAIPSREPLYGSLRYSAQLADLQFKVVGLLGGTVIKADSNVVFTGADRYAGFALVDGSSEYLEVGFGGELAMLVDIVNESDSVTRRLSSLAVTIGNNLLGSPSEAVPQVFPATKKGLSMIDGTTAVTLGAQRTLWTNPIEIGPGETVSVALYLPTLLTTRGFGTSAARPASPVKGSGQLGFKWGSTTSANVQSGHNVILRFTTGGTDTGGTIPVENL
ncbi:MAG: hypothetical protein JFR41_06185 [Muribaculaceae bacterium]|nr:hypothetical protein [Muribaculaceae bacterium]